MAIKLEGTVEFEGKIYEVDGEPRTPKCGDFWLDRDGTPVKATTDYVMVKYIILREVKPKPKYRPFASAEEFKPHRDRWIFNPTNNVTGKISCYDDIGVWVEGRSRTYQALMETGMRFEDGEPCGVPE